MMLSAQAAPAGPAGIALLGVRNRLHFTLTALANWHQPFRGRPLGEVKTQLSSYFFLLLFFFRSMSLPFVFRGVSGTEMPETSPRRKLGRSCGRFEEMEQDTEIRR